MTTTSILAGIHEGLAISSDQGCTWGAGLPDPVIDLVVRRNDPHTALALTATFAGIGDAGENLFLTRVVVTHDDGATWTQQGVSLDPEIQAETIDVAQSDPNRIYIGGARRQTTADGGQGVVGIVLSSTDLGATYVQSTIALNPANFENLGAAYVSAVDPNHPNRLYVRVGEGFIDRLLVSDDGAATFRTVYQGVGGLLGFALSGDGSKVFVGGPRDGLLVAPASVDAGAGPVFTLQSKPLLSCLSWVNGALYACMGEPQNSFLQELGVSNDDGATFATKFPLACLSGPLACAENPIQTACGGSIAARSEFLWPMPGRRELNGHGCRSSGSARRGPASRRQRRRAEGERSGIENRMWLRGWRNGERGGILRARPSNSRRLAPAT